MTERPALLDLYCGQGGAAHGYYLAGFQPVGVDCEPQPRYPYEFHQADALTPSTWPVRAWAAIHASPVCKLFTRGTALWRARGRDYPNQIPPTREILDGLGLPYVIENVPNAPIRPDFKLCGCMFGLRIDAGYLVRERWFETSWRGFDLRPPCQHIGAGAISLTGHGVDGWSRAKVGAVPINERRQLMGVPWMDRDGAGQAIPPAYTEYIGERLLAVVRGEAA